MSESLEKISSVVFDLNGTLVDNMTDHASLFGSWAFSQFNIDPQIAARHYLLTAGQPTSRQIHSLLASFGRQESFGLSHELGLQVDAKLELANVPVFNDVPAALSDLRNHDYKLSVSSSHATGAANQILERTGLTSYIDYVAGTDPTDPLFIKGEPHFRAIAHFYQVSLEIFVKQAVFVGDGISDMQAAVGVGMLAVGRIGTSSGQELLQAGARVVLTDLSELRVAISYAL